MINNIFKNKKFLVIAPHSDDEAFGCAGTLAKIKDLGGKTYVMCMSMGTLKHYNENHSIVNLNTRKKEFLKTMELLKVDDYDIIYESDELHLRMDTLSRREIIAKIERESKLSLDVLKPDIVAIPSISYNQDHEMIFKAAFTACRPGYPGIKHTPDIVLIYDNPTLFWNLDSDKFKPNFYVDISDYIDIKLKALSMHKSQTKPEFHHLSKNTLLHHSLTRGSEISVKAAEAYMCYRVIC